jgi:shikimate kinase
MLLTFSEDNCILSTGGSAIYYDDAMMHLKSLGKVIYLKVGLDIIKERLGDFSKRGIALRKGQTIDDLYKERCELYEKYADITINCNGSAFPRYHAALIEGIKKYL